MRSWRLCRLALITETESDDTSESASPHVPREAVEPDSDDVSLPASPDLPSIYGSDEEFGDGSWDRPARTNLMRPTWWEIESEDEQGDDGAIDGRIPSDDDCDDGRSLGRPRFVARAVIGRIRRLMWTGRRVSSKCLCTRLLRVVLDIRKWSDSVLLTSVHRWTPAFKMSFASLSIPDFPPVSQRQSGISDPEMKAAMKCRRKGGRCSYKRPAARID